jgi:hypothetical protein
LIDCYQQLNEETLRRTREVGNGPTRPEVCQLRRVWLRYTDPGKEAPSHPRTHAEGAYRQTRLAGALLRFDA